MKPAKYQELAKLTALYSAGTSTMVADLHEDEMVSALNLTYCVLGLVGEAGEIANKYKKIIRDGGGIMLLSDTQELADELGDVMWYVAMMCNELDIELEQVMENNITKLRSRKDRDKLQGSGDDR